MIEQLLFSE